MKYNLLRISSPVSLGYIFQRLRSVVIIREQAKIPRTVLEKLFYNIGRIFLGQKLVFYGATLMRPERMISPVRITQFYYEVQIVTLLHLYRVLNNLVTNFTQKCKYASAWEKEGSSPPYVIILSTLNGGKSPSEYACRFLLQHSRISCRRK